MNEYRLWRLVQLGVVLALAGSVWAVLSMASCSACRGAADLIGTHYLGIVGAAFYVGLSFFVVRRRAERLAYWGIFSAAGVHLVLLSLLHHEHLVCAPCLLTAAGALTAGLAALCCDGFRWRVHIWPFPLAFLLALVVATTQIRTQAQTRAALARSLLDSVSETAVSASKDGVLLIAFTRKGCHYCEQFDGELLPALKQRFGPTLELQHRLAPRELPTPSFVIVGSRKETIIGLPSVHALETALDRVRTRS